MDLFVTAVTTVMFLNLFPLIVQGQPQIFQLVTVEDNTCLQIQEFKGTFVPCKVNSTTFTANTVFLVNPGTPGYLSIQIFGTNHCLDREHCHSSTSDLRYSDCDHCGAIHWTINTNNGMVSEDGTNNCIYKDASGDAYIQHCNDGFQKFNVSNIGKHFQLKSTRYGDCLAGDRFMNCATAPSFYTTGLPGYLSIHIYGDPSSCIDREHCHSSTSNIRYYNCSHCGAIHWTINGQMVAEDGFNNCINRYRVNGTIMEHCSNGFEEFNVVIIPNNVRIVEKFLDNNSIQDSSQFPELDLRKYFKWDLSNGLCGVRLSKCANHGVLEPIMELEFVHYLPYIIPNAQYIVTHIHTNVPYSDSTSIFDVMNILVKDNSLITKYYIQYGLTGKSVTNNDGLLSNFITFGSVPTTGYTETTITRLLQGIKNGAFNNDHYHESFYVGQNNGCQWYLDFYTYGNISVPLYWPMHLSENQLNSKRF